MSSELDTYDFVVGRPASPRPCSRRSSAINLMVFTRGHRTGYDAWPAQGAKGTGFDDLLPHFKRSENTHDRNPRCAASAPPFTVGPATSGNPVPAACLDAAAEAGHPLATDVSSGAELGFGWPNLTIVNGRRLSAADAYLTPAADRPTSTSSPKDWSVYAIAERAAELIGLQYVASPR